jgi:hypothetical protein
MNRFLSALEELMDFIEISLGRLQEDVKCFLAPSAALCDVSALRAQIELRQRALADIAIIRRRLRPFMASKNPRQRSKSIERRVRRSRVSYRGRH